VTFLSHLGRLAGAALGAAVPLAAVLIAACGDERQGPDHLPPVSSIHVGTGLAADQTLRRALDAMPRSLDPSLLTDVDAQKVTDDLFEGLTALGLDGRTVPGVAASWEVSADGRNWVFHLRPEARWSNGEPVTAADFIYAWRRQVDPKTGSEYAQALAPIVGALAIATGHAPPASLGVEAPDPLTVRVALNAPTPYLLFLLADCFMQPLHRATIERWGDDWTRPEHWVSNGPFIVTEVVIGNRITLARNPRYWGAATVRPTRVVYYPLDTLTQVSRFMAGDIDITSIFPNSQFKWLKSQLGAQVVTGPYLGVTQMAVNMLGPPFGKSRDLRLALNLALDRTILADKVREGIQQPAFSLVPPLPGYRPQIPDWASWTDERRHAEARRLYAAAGYSAAHPLRVQVDYPTDEANRDLYDAIAAMWLTNLGAEVEPYNEEFRVLLQNLALHKSALFQNSWIGDYPDPFTFLQLFQTGFEQNFAAYSDPAYDALLAAAGQEADPVRRFGYFEQAEKRLNEEGVNIPVIYLTSRHLVKPYLKGWQLNIEDRMASRYMYLLEHAGG
jgi:oligopeptide transport system substrate-binding protein